MGFLATLLTLARMIAIGRSCGLLGRRLGVPSLALVAPPVPVAKFTRFEAPPSPCVPTTMTSTSSDPDNAFGSQFR